MVILVDDLSKFRFPDGLSRKNTILTYHLADWQLHLLCKRTQQLTKRKIKVFVVNDFLDIHTIPHFMAFLNFAAASNDEKETYLGFLQESEPFELDGEIFTPEISPTYIFDRDLANVKISNVTVNSEIFNEPLTLRFILWQELKKLEDKY